MAYQKQTFKDNETVLKAEHLDHIEYGIVSSAELDEEHIAHFKNCLGVVLFSIDLSGLGVPLEYGDLVLSAESFTIAEGGSGTFTVKLASAPSVNQVVYLAVSDESKVSVSPAFLTFTPNNWNTEQAVTITTVKDSNDYNDEITISLTSKNVDGKQLVVSIEDLDGIAYSPVTWNSTAVTAGNNDTAKYNAWCQHNLQYDKTRNQFIFLQCHCETHTGTRYASTLHRLDPANPTEYETINFPVDETGLCSLLIMDDGTWHIWSSGGRYTSTDGGENWTKEAVTGLERRFGIWNIGGTLYAGDDATNIGVYYKSTDGGLNWTTESFGDVGNYSDCEASFCQFKGEVYAFLRTNTTDYIVVLKQTADGWELVDDSHILAYTSSACPVAFKDYIAIAHCNRRDQHLYYTVWDGADGWVTEDLGDMGGGGAGDFHTAALAFGGGYAAIAFFTHSNESSEYKAAVNAWLVGAYEENKNTLHLITETVHGSDLIKAHANIYPADAEAVTFSGKYATNPNAYAVSLYNEDDPMLNCGRLSKLGVFVPTMQGKLCSFEREFATASSYNGSASLTGVMNYNYYAILTINGVYYQHRGTVLHRKPKVILGAELENLPVFDTPHRVLAYVEASANRNIGNASETALDCVTVENKAITLAEKGTVTISAESLTFADTATQTLTAFASSGAVKWRSDNTNIAKVADGVVTPVANGTCHIIVTAGTAMARCTVTVAMA